MERGGPVRKSEQTTDRAFVNESTSVRRREFLLAGAVWPLAAQAKGFPQIPNSCRLVGQICRYNGSHLRTSRSFAITPGGLPSEVEIEGARWSCRWDFHPVPDRPDAAELVLDYELAKGTSPESSVGLAVIWENWSPSNYVLLPGAAYNGNRFESRPIKYPPVLSDPKDIGVNVPTIISDIPRLNIHDGPSKIQLIAGDLATAAMGFQAPDTKTGFWLLTAPVTPLGDAGLTVEENDSRTQAIFTVVAPCVRQDWRYYAMSMAHRSKDRGHDFQTGDRVQLRFRLHFFSCSEIQGLFDRFREMRKDITGSGQLVQQLPFSAAWRIQEEKYNRENWKEEGGYYRVGDSDSPYDDWQVGWESGMLVTHPLLFEGSSLSHQRALRNFDFLFDKGAGKSGFFHGVIYKGQLYGDGFGHPHAKKWHLIRKSGDALYYLTKQYMLLEKQEPGWRIPERWSRGTLACADAFVSLWKKYGQFGQFVDIDTGDIVVGGSCCGSPTPAGLALASQYFRRPKYLQVAEQSAESYHTNFVSKGITTGGPGEILQCPDQESAYALLESYLVLYEITGRRRWIDMAIELAHQFASWVIPYDYPFPSHTTFGRLGMRSAGAIIANAQNKHGSPGICTHSGVALFKLYRATGDRFFLDLIRETVHNLSQYLSRADRPISNLHAGWMNERVEINDWNEPKGEIFYGSCWCEVSLMLTYIEIPGLYIQPDTGLVCAFDHVDASVEEQSKKFLRVRVTNPTKFPATVKLLVEDSRELGNPLGQNALWNCRKVEVPAASTVPLALERG